MQKLKRLRLTELQLLIVPAAAAHLAGVAVGVEEADVILGVGLRPGVVDVVGIVLILPPSGVDPAARLAKGVQAGHHGLLGRQPVGRVQDILADHRVEAPVGAQRVEQALGHLMHRPGVDLLGRAIEELHAPDSHALAL